jgi:hypothetical protein
VLFSRAREAAGALCARHSLRPLFSERRNNLHNSGEIAPRDRGVMFAVIASEAKQSISPRKKGRMDCFVASLLAMTVSNQIPLA